MALGATCERFRGWVETNDACPPKGAACQTSIPLTRAPYTLYGHHGFMVNSIYGHLALRSPRIIVTSLYAHLAFRSRSLYDQLTSRSSHSKVTSYFDNLALRSPCFTITLLYDHLALRSPCFTITLLYDHFVYGHLDLRSP